MREPSDASSALHNEERTTRRMTGPLDLCTFAVLVGGPIAVLLLVLMAGPAEDPTEESAAAVAYADTSISGMALRSDDRTGLLLTVDQRLLLCDLGTGTTDDLLALPDRGATCLAISRDAETVVAGYADGSVALLMGGEPAGRTVTNAHPTAVSAVAASPDGRRGASAAGGEIRVWDASSGRMLHAMPTPEHQLEAMIFSPDSRRLVSGGSGGTLRIWDASSGSQIRALTSDGRDIMDVSFAPDEQRLIAAGGHGLLRIWDVRAGRELWNSGKSNAWNLAIACSPDGSIVACAGHDPEICLWDLAARVPIATLRGHRGIVACLQFSRDGSRLFSAGQDGTLRVWDLALQAEIRRIQVP